MIHKTIAILLLSLVAAAARGETAQAVFAGGCFWCMEALYQEHEGVSDVVSGFSGGSLKNPSYAGDHTGHYEVVKVTYDPQRISYGELLDIYWRNVDPFDGGGQFCDRGPSYRSAIFVGTDGEREQAQRSLQGVRERFPGQSVATVILERAEFWPVEEGHQDYYQKNPRRYKFYRWNCGRDKRLEEIQAGSQAS